MSSKIASLTKGNLFVLFFVPLLFISDLFLTAMLQGIEEVPFVYFSRWLLLAIVAFSVVICLLTYQISQKLFSTQAYCVGLAFAYSLATAYYVGRFLNPDAGIFFPKLIIESLLVNIVVSGAISLVVYHLIHRKKNLS